MNNDIETLVKFSLELLKNIKNLDKDISKIVDDNFWDILL